MLQRSAMPPAVKRCRSGRWEVRASEFAQNSFNPIRSILETMEMKSNEEKPMIALSIGDPTVFGNLKPAAEVIESMVASVRSSQYNGYAPSIGYSDAREAVAEYCSVPGAPVKTQDVILCSGCSCALDLCIMVLASPGQTILVPRPGFPIYQSLANGLGIKTRSYNLLPERNWEVDLSHLESQIDDTIAAIVVNNPSNPCGSVYCKEHLQNILDVAQRNFVPIIADEIYSNFVFPGYTSYTMASLTTEVPILSCGGLTKRFLVPGWRMGWILIQDKNNVFDSEIRQGLQKLSQRIIGSNTLVQGALPSILANTPQQFFEDTIAQIKSNADLAYTALSSVPGLQPVMPGGAMYMMVGVDMQLFPHISSDLQFVEQLITEESVFCLPGRCFDYPNYLRIVLTVPAARMSEACERIREFCFRHCKLGPFPLTGKGYHLGQQRCQDEVKQTLITDSVAVEINGEAKF